MRTRLWPILGMAALAALAGCGHKPAGGGANAQSVALVTDVGGIDDQSFNAASWAGLQRAEKELGVKARAPMESHEQADYAANLATMADQGYGLVIAVGYLMEDALKEVAPKYPNTKFAIIDGNAPNLPNCVSLKFREEESSYLGGFLAAKMSRTGTVGFVGGIESPQLKKFECGYHAGAWKANQRVKCIAKYVGDFKDNTKGQLIAEEEMRQGADIIFAAAGKSGLGVLDAVNAKGPGAYAIGVDADQDGIHPGRVLTSVMKGIDTAVYETARAFKEGKWRSGEVVLGLKEGGVHLSPMRFTRANVPADVLKQLEAEEASLKAGRFAVPKDDAELSAFLGVQRR